ELEKALKLGIQVMSYPEFIFEHSKDKKRVVIAGSHGKTSTTSMILHVLKSIDSSKYEKDLRFDYLVGAQLEGFQRMVQLSDAPIMVIEGDEYLSSPIDKRPKFLHYKPHIAVITGIAWDHINVFPTFEEYTLQFELFLESIAEKGIVFYFKNDNILKEQVKQTQGIDTIPYEGFDAKVLEGQTFLITDRQQDIPLHIFGQHNLENLQAAYLVCRELGITDEDFFQSIQRFEGAARRLQLLREEKEFKAFLDFAHAPSKVKATIEALKHQYQDRGLVACVELHTFSSLSKPFLKEYKGAMNKADIAIVFFSEHTLKMKKLQKILPSDIQVAFDHPNLKVFTENEKMLAFLKEIDWDRKNLVMMTSGNFNGLDLKADVQGLEVGGIDSRT
ncbi:MAG: UDP-N-acetylmuramate: L-alanyl-gamma-D-glutamyl-meso-diaminopimelate ligase, partial [Saprospiraceae bacterium]